MSALSNQLEAKRLKVLKDLACWPDRQLAEKDAHELGLDVDILVTTYEANVKPYLDFILGYEDLSGCDPQDGQHRWKGCDTWWDVLGRYGILTQYRQVIKVLRVTLCTVRQIPDLQVSIFLSRKGQWIVWHKQSGYGGSANVNTTGGEHLAVFEATEEMCAYFGTLVTDDYHFAYRYGDRKFPEYMPLRIAKGLLSCLESTIEKRKEYLVSFESAHGEGTKRLSHIECSGS